jgi:hypothetical protein
VRDGSKINSTVRKKEEARPSSVFSPVFSFLLLLHPNFRIAGPRKNRTSERPCVDKKGGGQICSRAGGEPILHCCKEDARSYNLLLVYYCCSPETTKKMGDNENTTSYRVDYVPVRTKTVEVRLH